MSLHRTLVVLRNQHLAEVKAVVAKLRLELSNVDATGGGVLPATLVADCLRAACGPGQVCTVPPALLPSLLPLTLT